MSALWIASIGASLACYLLKIIGYSVPKSWLNRPRFQRINELIPVVLLSALIAVQTFGDAGEILIDHRALGVLAAALALKMRASFPVMMLAAAFTSAAVYNLL